MGTRLVSWLGGDLKNAATVISVIGGKKRTQTASPLPTSRERVTLGMREDLSMSVKKQSDDDDLKLSPHDAAGLIIASATAARPALGGRITMRQGLRGGKEIIVITLTGFRVESGVVIDLVVANGGKPEVEAMQPNIVGRD